MRASLIFGMGGIILSLALGKAWLGMPAGEILLCIAAANLAAFVSVLSTLQAQQGPSLARLFVKGTAGSWIFLSVFFLAIQLGLAPPMRDFHTLAVLLLPLVLSAYFLGVPCVGWVQDRLVRGRQNRARAKQAV